MPKKEFSRKIKKATEQEGEEIFQTGPQTGTRSTDAFHIFEAADQSLSSMVLGAGEINWSTIDVPANPYLPQAHVATANLAADGIVSILCMTHAIKRAYLNYIYIRDAKDYILHNEIEELSYLEIQKAQQYYKLPTTEAAIKKVVRNNMVGGIIQNTLAPGIAGTALFTGICVSLSVFFPPLAPLMFVIGLAFIGTGLSATIAATITNRHFMLKKLKKLFSEDRQVGVKIREKAKEIEALPEEKKFGKFRRNKSFASKISDRMLDFLATVKAFSVLNYLSLVVKNITATVQHIVMIVMAAALAAKNYYERKEKFHRFSIILAEKFIPKINVRKYLFFGKTPFEQFITDNVKLEKNQSYSSFIDYLKYEKPDLYRDAQELCVCEEIKKQYHKFCGVKALNPNEEDSYKEFVSENVANNIKRDVRISGYSATFSITVGLLSLSFAFPPILIAGGIFAAATAIAGVITTETVTKNEKKRFKEKLTWLVEASEKEELPMPKNHTEKYDAQAISFLKLLKNTVAEGTSLTSSLKEKDSKFSSTTPHLTREQIHAQNKQRRASHGWRDRLASSSISPSRNRH